MKDINLNRIILEENHQGGDPEETCSVCESMAEAISKEYIPKTKADKLVEALERIRDEFDNAPLSDTWWESDTTTMFEFIEGKIEEYKGE